MKSIYKYELSIKEKQNIELPIGAKIIRVEDVDGKIFLWAIVAVEETQTETKILEFYKTGQPIENYDNLIYIGFCKLFVGQELGLYVFERIKPVK